MGFTSRVNAISNSVDNGNDNSGYENTPGVYLCKVTAVEESPEEHTGAPYLLFKMRTSDNKMISAKLWVARDEDDETKANNKDNRIKKVFEAFGIDMEGKDGAALMAEAIDKEANFAFQSREYVGKDKSSGMPEIKTVLNYFYCGKVGDKINDLNESNYIQRLNEADERKFADMKATWDRQNKPQAGAKTGAVAPKSGASNPSTEAGDGLPF